MSEQNPPVREQDSRAMRRAMVESQLRTSDINDPAIIAAFLAEPREAYLPAARRTAAYIDRAVPLAGGRALNPPVATARLLAQAAPRAGEKVLLVGAATGYAAALLARLGCDVVALEADADLADQARALLDGRPGVRLVTGPLAAGHPRGAPYDLLFIDGAVEEIGDALVGQLRVGGRAVFAANDRGVTRLCLGTRSQGGFGARAFVDSEAVPLPGFARAPAFTF
jgi:protein-L-isoaspartate(D-aspartate) O-methyltransferase